MDYLIKYIGKNTPLADKWKMINVFIGFNDVSVSCLPGRNSTDYYNNVYTNLERLLQNVDYAFVNLGKHQMVSECRRAFLFLNTKNMSSWNDALQRLGLLDIETTWI